VLEVGEKAAEMGLKRFGGLLYFGQAVMHDAAIPLPEESVAGIGVGLLPELDHLLLVGPGLRGAQVGFEQLLRTLLLVVRGLALKPEETGAFEGVVVVGGELARFLSAV
jgi:hypothetical protein